MLAIQRAKGQTSERNYKQGGIRNDKERHESSRYASHFILLHKCKCIHCKRMLIIHEVGLVTNGEWNSLRTTGNNRPLSVFQIRSSVRLKYSKLKEAKLMKMLAVSSCRGDPNDVMLCAYICSYVMYVL